MKKLIIFMICFIVIILLTGCGNSTNKQTILCRGTITEEGMTYQEEITAAIENEIIVKVSNKTIYETKDDAKAVCEVYKLSNKNSKGSNKINYKCNGNAIEIKNYENVFNQMGINVKNTYVDEFIILMNDRGLTCYK